MTGGNTSHYTTTDHAVQLFMNVTRGHTLGWGNPRTVVALLSVPTSLRMLLCRQSRCIAAGPVAQWIRHRPTEPGIAGSSPVGVIQCCLHVPSCLQGYGGGVLLVTCVHMCRDKDYRWSFLAVSQWDTKHKGNATGTGPSITIRQRGDLSPCGQSPMDF